MNVQGSTLESSAPVTPPARSFSWTVVIPVLLLSWLLFLAVQVAFHANPLSLNYVQLQKAEHLWQGKVLDISPGNVEITQDLRAEGVSSSKEVIKNLKDSRCMVGEEYLLPVIKNPQGEYEIAPVLIKNQPFFPVYPWNQKTKSRLEQVLPQLEKP